MLPICCALAAVLAQAEPAAGEHAHHHHHEEMTEAEPGLAALETDRIVSGTAWQPGGAPHNGWHFTPGDWQLMLHGILFGGYDWQAGPRGGQKAVGIGWLMAMARHDGVTNALVLRAMLSPEPWTVRDGGYPLLLQTGETYQGQLLHDRQHPHDLFMELGAVFTQQLTSGLALQGYGAISGEPALGPVAFPHRMSAMADPLAALGHHWLDSTHISFGVLTLGLVTRVAKLEGSWFNGREPDERRWDLDLRPLDSWSARLAVALTDSAVGQLSFGRLASPEEHHPGALERGTASISHLHALEGGGSAATLLAFGFNRMEGVRAAALAESTVDLDGANVLFTRLEWVQKSGEDLALAAPLADDTFDVLEIVAGYLRNLGTFGGVIPGIGVRASGNYLPASLGPTYGGRRFPVGGLLYVRLLPAPMHHH
jgi:hypothetical protein